MAEPEEEAIISSIFRLKKESSEGRYYGLAIEFDTERPQDAMLKVGGVGPVAELRVPVSVVRRLVQAFQDKYPFAFEEKQD